MEQKQKSEQKQELKKDELIELVKANLSGIEAGLEFFDENIPSILGETIDLVAITRHKRLVMLEAAPKKVTTTQAAKFALRIYYLWNFICDFREDFYTEVEAQKEIKLALKPPRIVVLIPETSAKLLAYLSHFQKCYIDVEAFIYQVDGGKLKVVEESLEDVQPLKKSEATQFNVNFRKVAVRQLATWENWLGENSTLRGYDKERGILEFLGVPVELKLPAMAPDNGQKGV